MCVCVYIHTSVPKVLSPKYNPFYSDFKLFYKSNYYSMLLLLMFSQNLNIFDYLIFLILSISEIIDTDQLKPEIKMLHHYWMFNSETDCTTGNLWLLCKLFTMRPFLHMQQSNIGPLSIAWGRVELLKMNQGQKNL